MKHNPIELALEVLLEIGKGLDEAVAAGLSLANIPRKQKHRRDESRTAEPEQGHGLEFRVARILPYCSL